MASPPSYKARNLERVRLNQQRSRERKREYVTQLEAEVAKLRKKIETLESSTAATAGRANEELTLENNVRGHLLEALGIGSDEQRRFIRMASAKKPLHLYSDVFNQNNTQSNTFELGQSIALDATDEFDTGSYMPREDLTVDVNNTPCIASTRYTWTIGVPNHINSTADSQALEYINPNVLTGDESWGGVKDALSLSPCAQQGEDCCDTSTKAYDSTVLSEDESHTTACSVAFKLVHQNNRRGYPFTQLQAVMRKGYLKAHDPYTDCRILNKVLFHVLAQIA